MKRKMIKRIFITVLVMFLAIGIPVNEVEASTANWEVYYASGGGNKYTHTVSVYTSGGGYIVRCNGVAGNCLSKKVVFSAHTYNSLGLKISAPLNNTVAFTTTGSITTNTVTMPSTTTIYFKASLEYSNGTSASFAGTVSGR